MANGLLTESDIDAIKSQLFDCVKDVVKDVLMSFEFPPENYLGARTVYCYDFHLHYGTPT
jgi:hypothetical protein